MPCSCGIPSAGPPNYKILQDLGPSKDEEESEASTQQGTHASKEHSAGKGTRVSASEEASGSGRGNQGEGNGVGEGEGGEGEEQMAAAPGSISILESCLVDWASKSRVRLKVTVRVTHSADNGEVELEVRLS